LTFFVKETLFENKIIGWKNKRKSWRERRHSTTATTFDF